MPALRVFDQVLAVSPRLKLSCRPPFSFGILDQNAADVELAGMVERARDTLGHGEPELSDRIAKIHGAEKGSDWRKMTPPESLWNIFRSRLSGKLVAQLVGAHSRKFAFTYTHYVQVRLDTVITTPLVWSPMDMRASIRVPDFANNFVSKFSQYACLGGVNDRFVIGQAKTLLPLLLARVEWAHRFSLVQNSEHLWCTQLASARVSVGLLEGMRLTRVRANGENETLDDARTIVPQAPRLCEERQGLRLVHDWDSKMGAAYKTDFDQYHTEGCLTKTKLKLSP